MTTTPSKWCGAPFPAKKDKLFCRSRCRHDFHDACRRYCEQSVEDGYLDIPTIKRVAAKHRARLSQRQQGAAA